MENEKDKNKEAEGEKIADLKKQSNDPEEVKKGYNEKNPVQEEGAFKPDSKQQE